MDFALSDEQVAIRDMARDFGRERIAPFAQAWEAAGTIPREVLREAAALGFAAMYVPEDDGRRRPDPARRGAGHRGAGDGLPGGVELRLDPQHVRRMIARHGTEALRARIPARRRHHGDDPRLLPDRARLGLGRRRAPHPRRARRRRLAARRHQGLHLRRRLRRPLRRDGAHRRRRPEGHLGLPRRGRHARPLLRRSGAQDGLEGAADRAGAARRLPGAGRQPARRARARASATRCRASTAAGSTSPPRRSAARRRRSTSRSPTPASAAPSARR